MTLLTPLWWALGFYLAIGLVFALPYLVRGMRQHDPSALGSSWVFKLLLLPSTVLLWPVLLRKWAQRSSAQPNEATRP
jgi:membrane-anchored glycerophosphoryl diester phosphodiesterase (GDPDase)